MRTNAWDGFTLVEVLVALLIVALAAGGAAGLHARALAAAGEAARLADAVQLANALAARMRANRAVMGGDAAANPYLHFDTGDGASVPPASSPCFSSLCDALALARFDLSEAGAEAATRLPGGRIAACRDGAGPDPATGEPSWACDDASDGPVVVKVGWRTAGVPDAPRVVLPLGEVR